MIENISNQLAANYKKSAKRPGRGISAGQGKTAGRGTKGQKSRAGHNIPNRFEGGQTVLSMRLPKLRGFKSIREKAEIVSLDDISKSYKSGETVSIETLKEKGVITKNCDNAKILNSGALTIKVKLGEISASKSVLAIVEAKNSEKKTQTKTTTEEIAK